MQRVNQRQGFLVSAIVHLTLLMILVSADPTVFDPKEVEPEELEKRELVFLPSAEVLRQMAPPPPAAARPRPAPRPAPTPPPPSDPNKKDRISIGPPTEVRREGPMILREEDDLTKAPKGRPDADPNALPAPPRPRPTPPPRVAENQGGDEEVEGREGLRLPPGLVGPPVPTGGEGARQGGPRTSAESTMDELARRMARDSRLGIPTGTGKSIEGLRFDPRGADFTVWISDFKNQVYRNWIVPQAALLGYAGHVDFEFTIERDGSMSALRMLKSSGTSSLDRAARNSLTASSFMTLPADYGPPRVTMQVTFFYNEGPRGS